MQHTYSSIDKIRAELAWVHETSDPNKSGCCDVRCLEQNGKQARSMYGGSGLGNLRSLR